MATQYIGARYVPIFADPAEWNDTRTYEPLTIVLHEGNSYTSKQYVPAGIDIDNDKFWAETGDYNAQVEQYRQDVARYATEVNNVSAALNAEVERATAAEKANADAIAAEQERATAAEKANADAISAEQERATAAEKVNADAISKISEIGIVNSTKNLIHYGAIDLSATYPDLDSPQGFCIKNDTLVCVSTNSDTNNNCVVFDVDIKTGSIVNETNVDWGHANSIAYDKTNNVMYVCPCYDYTNEKQKLNYILKVDPTTYKTIDKITFDFTPHSIAFDPITNECIITGERSNPYGIDFYKINKNNWEPAFLFSLDTSLTELNFAGSMTFGKQNVRSYNGYIWYLISTDLNALLMLNPETGKIEKTITGFDHSFIYDIREVECFDFTSDGDIYLWSYSSYYARYAYGVVSMLNVYGDKCIAGPNTAISNRNLNVYLRPSFNKNICKFGTNNLPFTSICECLQAIKYNNATTIVIDEDYNCPEIQLDATYAVKIALSDCKFTLNGICKISEINIIRQSGSPILNIGKEINFDGIIRLSNLTVTGSTLNIINGGLIATTVAGGVFSGAYQSFLVKSASNTGTYSNFITTTAN